MANTDGTQPFDPGVASSGASTNLIASASASMPKPDMPLWVGHDKQTGYASGAGGKFANETGMPGSTGGTYSYSTPIYLTGSQLLNAYDKMDRDDFLRFRNLFVAAGIVNAGADPATVRGAYAGVIDNIQSLQEQGIKMSPMGLIKSLISKNGLSASDIGSDVDYDPFNSGVNFTGSKAQVSRTVSEIDEGEAWASLQGTLSQMLGRDPSDQESRDFVYRMNQSAAQNPSVSRTVTQYKDGDAVSQTTHNRPGFTSADMAREAYDQAQNDPDYAEYRGSSYLFNAAINALGEIGG